MGGIGTYSEKTLHRELKWRIEPTGASHEVPVGKYIADIKTEYGITEIQTQSFYKLRAKLSALLPEYAVTLVYPLAREKKITWVDADTGEIIRTRRSPKRGSFYAMFQELYQIKALLTDANLTLQLVLADVTERRVASDRSRKGYSAIDTRIESVCDELFINSARDYAKLIPDSLGERFTSSDYAAAAKLSRRNAGTALNVLNHVGAVRRVGKSGRYIMWARPQPSK